MSQHGQPLPPEATVYRMVRPLPLFRSSEGALTADVFVPNTGDKTHAQKRGEPVRVSVWEKGRTTPEQAQAIFGGGEALLYDLCVGEVLALAGQLACPTMRIVYDELDEPDRSKPGADGHAGIEGLERGPGETKVVWRERLRRLALLARPAA